MSSSLPSNIAIRARNLGKRYFLYQNPLAGLKQAMFGKSAQASEFWALRDIDFDIARGQALGVVGRNGAGKSTLLQILAGTLTPTTGELWTRGSMASLLELGSGFNPEFSGRENVYVNGAILGLSKKQIDDRFEEILAFSELEDFIDQPVKTYSSGMYIRLAFSVQVCIEPEILIVDEALAVGDTFFQVKCHQRMEQLLQRGTAVLLVSHDTGAIRKYCDSLLLLEEGRSVYQGDVEKGLSHYFMHSRQTLARRRANEAPEDASAPAQLPAGPEPASSLQSEGGLSLLPGWPKGRESVDIGACSVVVNDDAARLTRLLVCDSEGRPCTEFEQGQVAHFFWEAELRREVGVLIGSLTLLTANNIPLYCRNTAQAETDLQVRPEAGTRVLFQAAVRLDVAIGRYVFQVNLGSWAPDAFERRRELSAAAFASASTPLLHAIGSANLSVRERSVGIPNHTFGFCALPDKFSIHLGGE
ncbi:MAG: ATP-binding cassette domain-containing protein [Desulfarculaceae bacterium]|nr:ATP-binding cassette domain-containing protein [Desulfarculaceae bacterium]